MNWRNKIKVLVFVLCGSLSTLFAQKQVIQGKLEYMISEPSEAIFEIAKRENKPVLIYIHSQSCMSSKKFSREIMNHYKVKAFLKKKYVCMNADVSSKIGQHMASKHGVLITPMLFVYSPGKEISYQCNLEIDTFEMMKQFRAFVTACNLLDQVKMKKKTSDMSEKQIIKEIGVSYAIHDYKKDPNIADITSAIYNRTLDLPYFKEFELGYREEWERQQKLINKTQNSEVSK